MELYLVGGEGVLVCSVVRMVATPVFHDILVDGRRQTLRAGVVASA